MPVKLIHCTADIAYPLPHFQEFQEVMEGVGSNVSVNHVEGAAHFGNVTHGPQYVFVVFWRRIYVRQVGAETDRLSLQNQSDMPRLYHEPVW